MSIQDTIVANVNKFMTLNEETLDMLLYIITFSFIFLWILLLIDYYYELPLSSHIKNTPIVDCPYYFTKEKINDKKYKCINTYNLGNAKSDTVFEPEQIQYDQIYDIANHPFCKQSNEWGILSTNCVVNE